jgi:hypothetical protein
VKELVKKLIRFIGIRLIMKQRIKNSKKRMMSKMFGG